MIKIITEKERKRMGNLYCSFCRPEKILAIYRRPTPNHKNGYACENHKIEIEKLENKNSNHYSEADYQTWMRL